MPFKYRSLTANCGNDTLGLTASQSIAELFVEDDADFFVINCQEAHFRNTQEQLERFFPQEKYEVRCLSQMPTHTKLDTQVFPTTGMATFVIYKKELDLRIDGNPQIARRENSRLDGSGYNKGGMVTNFSIERKNPKERIQVQAVTGHLDANNAIKRNKDWLNIYRATVKRVTSWNDLMASSPDLLLSGYDANTRNKFNEQNDKIDRNMWDDPAKYPEIQAMDFVSKAAAKYSKDITYAHTKRDPQTGEEIIADSKREGDAARGMLDFVTIYDGDISHMKSRESIEKGITVVDIEPQTGSDRDHHVIISPSQTSLALTDFNRIKNLMAARLWGVAPVVSKQILAIKEGTAAADQAWRQLQLIDYYNEYLAPGGFLDRSIELHRRKLEYFQEITDNPALDDALKENLRKIFFEDKEPDNSLDQIDSDQLDQRVEQLKAKQVLMQTFLDSLAQCKHVSGIEARFFCYNDLKKQIENNIQVNAAEAFKSEAVREYHNYHMMLEMACNEQEDPELQKALKTIIKRLDAIVDPTDANALNNMDPGKLDTLTQIAALCHKRNLLLKQEEVNELDNINRELISLSHDAMGSDSSLWRALAEAVKFFISLVPEGWSKKVGIVQDKKLSDSLLQYSTVYKSALQDIVPREEEEGDVFKIDGPSGMS